MIKGSIAQTVVKSQFVNVEDVFMLAVVLPVAPQTVVDPPTVESQ